MAFVARAGWAHRLRQCQPRRSPDFDVGEPMLVDGGDSGDYGLLEWDDYEHEDGGSEPDVRGFDSIMLDAPYAG